ncbi:MAG: hypothetical protein CMP73_05985 [Flavobacteriales bacterium]|nr:hypothetical protein [Flavobacteriales bacterium]
MRFFSISFLILLPSFLFSTEIKLNETNNNFVITSKNTNSVSFVNYLSEIKAIKLKNNDQEFVKLLVDGYGENTKSGYASLPVIEELLIVPDNSNISIEIENIEEEIINLSDYNITQSLYPFQPSISKGEDISNVPFYFDNAYYSYKEFHINKLVETKYLGKMRGQQLARLLISPFSYNPSNNQLKIVTKIEVKLTFKNINIENEVNNRKKFYSSEFENLFKKAINYVPLENLTKDIITTYPVKYVIVSDPNFQSAIQPLIEWKTKKGFLVIEAYTNDPLVGNTTNSIRNYIKDMYDNATPNDPAPTYLLLVGDEAQVPSFNGNAGSHISDMYYCEFDGGGDFYPEMYYGRFSGTISEHIERQVEKTLMHEMYTFPNPSFLEDIVLVAGVDASMAPTYGNGQINYGTNYYFNAAHNHNVHNYLYGVLAPGALFSSDMSGASSAIINDISDGSSFANYTAHCGPSGWSDPSFENSDISGLNNINKFGVMIGNCCQSNKFDEPVCFGESLLRANKKGAVGYIGGSNNTYWDEDYWWAIGNATNITANPSYAATGLGVYDCLMHENGEQESDWFITQGQILHSGNLAVTQAGGSEQYYWEIYHVMGDPSLMPYIGVPTNLLVSHSPIMPLGSTTLSVNTEEHAYVAISKNGILLDAQIADASGLVSLVFPSISTIGVADIVITKQFKQPYIGTVQVISPTGPYVISSNNTINDPTGNNNSLADYNELIDVYMDLENVGAVSATNLNVTVSTLDPYVNMVNTNVTVPNINSSQIITTINPITFQVATLIPDQHVANFDVEITDNLGNIWNSVFSITLNAPNLTHNSFSVNDALSGNNNGKLDAGETLDLIIGVNNLGHSDIFNLVASLNSLSTYVTINNVSINGVNLVAGQQQLLTFNVTVSNTTPLATPVNFAFNISDGFYTYTNTFNEVIGIIDEDYETGDFTQFSWIQGTYPWIIDNSNVYEGMNSSRSAYNLPNNQDSELSITLDVVAPGEISFWKYLSSEQDYDFLKFRINGNKVDEWSGEDVDWSFVSFPVNVGQNTFKWEYDKDDYVSDGQDCAWIDYIVFPPIDLGLTGQIDYRNFNFKLFPNPTIGKFLLNFNDNNIHTVQIFDGSGKLIITKHNQFIKSDLDLSEFSSGTYTIKVIPENITYQIIKN